MQIYIGNLSAEITSFDLAQFFNGYGDYPSFTFKYYQKGQKRFHYAVTSISPDSLARQAIRRCHMKRAKGRSIVLHPYKDRVIINERRGLNWRGKPWASEERRTVNRRQVQHDKISNDAMAFVELATDRAHFW